VLNDDWALITRTKPLWTPVPPKKLPERWEKGFPNQYTIFSPRQPRGGFFGVWPRPLLPCVARSRRRAPIGLASATLGGRDQRLNQSGKGQVGCDDEHGALRRGAEGAEQVDEWLAPSAGKLAGNE